MTIDKHEQLNREGLWLRVLNAKERRVSLKYVMTKRVRLICHVIGMAKHGRLALFATVRGA